MPHAHSNEDLDTYAAAESTRRATGANMRAYTVSLLKAWWGPRPGKRTISASITCPG